MSFETEIENKNRFRFGSNWSSFLETVDDMNIQYAVDSLSDMLNETSFSGKTFLDIGSGSGIFSLAALKLGAKVYSFDYDPESVACARKLKSKFCIDDDSWVITEGSILDSQFISSLDTFDIVYSWGVLHHTGAMWNSIQNAATRVKPGGKFFIAIYNDQGVKSHFWWLIKYTHNRLPHFLKAPFTYIISGSCYLVNCLRQIIKGNGRAATRQLLHYKHQRGMSLIRDMHDWVGGFPYEFSTLEVLTEFLENQGFNVIKTKKASSLGCHQITSVRNFQIEKKLMNE